MVILVRHASVLACVALTLLFLVQLMTRQFLYTILIDLIEVTKQNNNCCFLRIKCACNNGCYCNTGVCDNCSGMITDSKPCVSDAEVI